MKHLPRFVSANIHRSFDGVRVTNYAQWRSREHFEDMLQNPDATAHMKPIMAIAEFDAPKQNHGAIWLRWWRDVLILNQPKRHLDDRQARKYWLILFRKIR